MEWLCGFTIGVVLVTVVGHFIWVAIARFFRAATGTNEQGFRAPRPFRYCPGCGEYTTESDIDCQKCGLVLDGRRARDLHRVRVAEREVLELIRAAQISRADAEPILDQLAARARAIQGLPAKRGRVRAMPVAPAPEPASAPVILAPADAVELVPPAEGDAAAPPPTPATTPEPLPEPALAPASETEPPLLSPVAAAALTDARDAAPILEPIPEPVPKPEAREPEPRRPRREPHEPREPRRPREPRTPPPPKRRLSNFLEDHNILWGELVGGLLIVGCSIALVVTLRQTLEAIPYFRFMLSAAVTLALFGAGQYTLHRWKLAGTSRGMLVISMLLTPLTLLLLAAPFTEGTEGALDIGVKLAALAAFVGVVRTGGRDLIGTEHLPGPIDRRWLLALAVVGTAGTQLLPAAASSAWWPLLCFIVACAATLGGLSWYHPGKRDETISDKSGTALLMFVGLASFSLLASWGLYLFRAASDGIGPNVLALPLALAGVPVVEAGVLVLRRVASSVAIRTIGTATALVGFVGITAGLALAWPNALTVLLVSAATGAYLTRVAFRERLPWVQIGALPLLALAAVIGFHGLTGNWTAPAGTNASYWLGAKVGAAESGAVLSGFALVLTLVAFLLARVPSRQAPGYALGALAIGAVGLLVVSWHGVQQPAIAAFAHLALALGLLASHFRYARRSTALGGLWLVLAGSLWMLWWLAPRRPELWALVVAVEALVFALGAVKLRGALNDAIALLRRAARDMAFAACVLAVALALASGSLSSPWHAPTLLVLTGTFCALARLTGSPILTWAGSVALLLGLVHLYVYISDSGSYTFDVELAILLHSTFTASFAVMYRRQARVFGDPFRWSARLSSVLAVPLLFFPPVGLAFAYAPLAVWLGFIWLAFVFLWRERGAFPAFQGAITLASLLLAFGWIEQQTWWASTPLHIGDPRAMHAFGLALGALAIMWVIARRLLSLHNRAREWWCDDPLSFDRFALAATVIGFLALHAIAISPGVRAEFTPTAHAPFIPNPVLAHAFEPTAWLVFSLLAVAVLLSWRLSKLVADVNPHAIGVSLLALAVPVVWAGTHGVDVAAASALRWGLAVAFVCGATALALRVPIRRVLTATGFAVQPEPWLRGGLLAIFTAAAVVVVLLSAQVAEIGLSRLTPSGPDPRSIFALMGVIASNITPLALVVFGLALTAARERSSGYALSGGLVFVATIAAGYALTITTAGLPFGGTEFTRMCLLTASSAAVWALAWLASERRVPGGIPLVVQVCLAYGVLAFITFVPALALIGRASEPLPASFEPIGQFGWLALALVSAAGFWQARRWLPSALPLVFGFAGLVVGPLAAASVRSLDVPEWWLSFHVLALVWVAVAFGLYAYLKRGTVAHAVLALFAMVLVSCALRAGWHDPWKPWFSVGLSLVSAFLFGALAVRERFALFTVASGLTANLAAILVWIAWGPDTFTGFLLANAIGLAAAGAVWTLVRIRHASSEGELWLSAIEIAPIVALGLLFFGLIPALGGTPSNPWSLSWGAVAAVALVGAVGLWDRLSQTARPVLYAAGVSAVLLGATQADQPLPVLKTPLAPLALACFALAVAALAVVVTRRLKPLLGMPENGVWRFWLPVAHILVALFAAIFGIRAAVTAPSIWERLASPLTMVLLAPAFVLLARIVVRHSRAGMRAFAVAFLVLAPAALAWAVPEPNDRFAWLHRNGWLFVALTVAAVVGSETASRLGANWQRIARLAAGWCAVAAVVVLCVNLLQQVPVYNPAEDVRRTPLAREASLSMLVAIAALIALALRFALKPAREPFQVYPRLRTVYVYAAEVLLVLFFAEVRLNVPELFLGNLAKLWTFAVMVLAYVGIGLAELFERKKIDVLASPLRRTGVLLPLIPLIAFWAKPPAFVNEFADGAAPGLVPFLNYLKNLPQHFDTYAWLWFLAGGVYGLLALSRKSFGWALLAALATNAALWSLLTHHQVPFFVHPQAWVIPLALIVLVSEHINRHRLSAEASNGMRYAGIAMIYVASAADMFIAGVGNSTWLPVILAVLCVAGVLLGILLRVRAFIYLGIGFLLLDMFSMIWYAAVDLKQTWVWYVSGIVLGVAVLALFAYLEKRRTHAKEKEPAEIDTEDE